jgi:hypothetical protein
MFHKNKSVKKSDIHIAYKKIQLILADNHNFYKLKIKVINFFNPRMTYQKKESQSSEFYEIFNQILKKVSCLLFQKIT